MPEFKDRLRELMHPKETVAEFAYRLGLSRTSVGYYLNGNRLPSTATLDRICMMTCVSADWLIGKTDAKTGEIDLAEFTKGLRAITQGLEILRNALK